MQLSPYGLLLLTQPLHLSEQHIRANVEFSSNFGLTVIWIEMIFQNWDQPLVYSKCTTVICFHLKIFQGADQVNYCHSQDYLGLQNVIKWLFFYCTNHNIFSGDFLVWWLIWLKMLSKEFLSEVTPSIIIIILIINWHLKLQHEVLWTLNFTNL